VGRKAARWVIARWNAAVWGRTRWVAAVALGLTFAACSLIAPPPGLSAFNPCTQEVYGACVIYDAGVDLIPDARMAGMFRAAAAHWGTPVDAITGYTVIVKGRDPYDLAGSWIWGVTISDMKRLDFATPVARCPDLVFIHEWGHAGAGVAGHEDPRFEDDAIRATLHKMPVQGC
jgi:hypothetical protein